MNKQNKKIQFDREIIQPKKGQSPSAVRGSSDCQPLKYYVFYFLLPPPHPPLPPRKKIPLVCGTLMCITTHSLITQIFLQHRIQTKF